MRLAGLISPTRWLRATDWRNFASIFIMTFAGGIATVFLFIALLDPYGMLPLSLPMERRIVSINQRYVYPQIVLSGRFDSVIIGTSTTRLLDPQDLNAAFQARFANLAMDSMTAWEQKIMVDFFTRRVGPPKVLVVALDVVWCEPDADQKKITFRGFPDWLYDDNRWNEYLYLLNFQTTEIAGRLFGNRLGLYRERVRGDGYEVFTPPEDQYDAAKAQRNLWKDRTPATPPDVPPPVLPEASTLQFPALPWLDEMLGKLPSTTKILAYMPVHVTTQPWPGTKHAAVEAECKARIAAIGRKHGAQVIDWRFASPITTRDTNYWDSLHYRLHIARQLARELIDAAIHRRPSPDHTYRIVVP